MDRRTVIPCYSTHHTQAWRYRGLWTDGQSYLAIAHTTLWPGDTEGYGYTYIRQFFTRLFLEVKIVSIAVMGSDRTVIGSL